MQNNILELEVNILNDDIIQNLNIMENREAEEVCNINHLPNEIISLILEKNCSLSILRFGSTCKRFNDLVNNDQSLWKAKFRELLPKDITVIVEKETDGDWLAEIKRYFDVKKRLCAELISMSPRYYWRTSDISLEDVRNIFMIAVSHSLNYYYTIISLQDIINHSKRIMDPMIGQKYYRTCQKPFTLTEVHYAKVALRHLIHSFLCVKWVKQHIKGELTPEVVVNFFVQWTDTDNLYFDETVAEKLQDLVTKVEQVLAQKHPSKTETVKERCTNGTIKERQILEAISHVLYQQSRMAITPTANVENLNLSKVIHYKCGNQIAVGAIYNAVAKKFGVNCDLISFPNHFYLEWRECLSERIINLYTIDLKTGEIHPKRRCPFSQGGPPGNYKYYPDSLLQFIYSNFHVTMGALKNWHTHNALHLLDFLGTDDNEYNPYRNFLPFLLDITHVPAMSIPLNLKYMHPTHLKIIQQLAQLNVPLNTVCRSVKVKKHNSNVKYAVGMICYHKKYDYVCIVRGWDYMCAEEWQRRMEVYNLEHGAKQPFYHVIAADQSERYVAQENLTDVEKPSRLYHLEDLIAREFTHFDGFAYIPNDEKKTEYPEEGPIVDLYRIRRSSITANNIPHISHDPETQASASVSNIQ